MAMENIQEVKHNVSHPPKKIMRQAMVFAILSILSVYLAMGAILYIFQSHFIYFPDREIVSNPHNIDLAYDAVTFKSGDGVELFGWYVPAERERAVILFCHGNGGNISDRLQYIKMFNSREFSVFIFDYRGFGKSHGAPTEEGTYIDTRSAWDYLTKTRGVDPGDIVIFGESLGGTLAARLAAETHAAALILQASFTSIPDMAAHLYPVLPARRLSRYHYNTLEYVRRVTVPVLIAHSKEDEIVPYSQGLELYRAAREPKQFFDLKGDHNNAYALTGEAYWVAIDQFLSRHIRRQITQRLSKNSFPRHSGSLLAGIHPSEKPGFRLKRPPE